MNERKMNEKKNKSSDENLLLQKEQLTTVPRHTWAETPTDQVGHTTATYTTPLVPFGGATLPPPHDLICTYEAKCMIA